MSVSKVRDSITGSGRESEPVMVFLISCTQTDTIMHQVK
jgi:hypothetical protein